MLDSVILPCNCNSVCYVLYCLMKLLSSYFTPDNRPHGEYVMKLTNIKNFFCILFCSPEIWLLLTEFRDKGDASMEQLGNKRSAKPQGRQWKGDDIKETELQIVEIPPLRWCWAWGRTLKTQGYQLLSKLGPEGASGFWESFA